MTAPARDLQTPASLDKKTTNRAIREIKSFFEMTLAEELNLLRVTAPIIVRAGLGLNDDLNGVERPVSFPVPALGGASVEIVQSLAKWKRLALASLGLNPGEGLYTDMNAIRPDEQLDEMHSIYVDQWDWERVMAPQDRNLSYLCGIVQRIYESIRKTEERMAATYDIAPELPPTISFVHTAELEARFPRLSRREREDRICRELGAVFLIGIGAPLADGAPHDGRAPDYDDWTTPTPRGPGLNGDILVWSSILERAFELSSMGIRVDAQALRRQLAARGAVDRESLYFHRRLLAGKLPESVGGGIGQSRLSMFLLRKRHIGEVQSGVWSDAIIERARAAGADLL